MQQETLLPRPLVGARVRYQDKLQLLEILFTEQPSGQELNIVTSAIILIVQGFTEQPSGQELNIITSAIMFIVQGFTEQPSGQELNIVTSAIILIVQGFISEALEEFGRYNYLAMYILQTAS